MIYIPKSIIIILSLNLLLLYKSTHSYKLKLALKIVNIFILVTLLSQNHNIINLKIDNNFFHKYFPYMYKSKE